MDQHIQEFVCNKTLRFKGKPGMAMGTLGIVLISLLPGCQGGQTSQSTPRTISPTPTTAATPDPVARGALLVAAVRCNGCHTPTKTGSSDKDPARLLSGHPADLQVPPLPSIPPGWGAIGTSVGTVRFGSFGVAFVSNLTPDKETGLGNWTQDQFFIAMRSNKKGGDPNGRAMVAPMRNTVEGLATLPDEDIKAIFAYLQSIPAVSNRVPNNIPPTPKP